MMIGFIGRLQRNIILIYYNGYLYSRLFVCSLNDTI